MKTSKLFYLVKEKKNIVIVTCLRMWHIFFFFGIFYCVLHILLQNRNGCECIKLPSVFYSNNFAYCTAIQKIWIHLKMPGITGCYRAGLFLRPGFHVHVLTFPLESESKSGGLHIHPVFLIFFWKYKQTNEVYEWIDESGMSI